MLLALVGCSTAPDPWGCQDVERRAQAVLGEWEQRPGDAVESISQLPDELEKIRVISMLIDHHPGKTGALCELLPHGVSKERCVYVNAYPTTWFAATTMGEVHGRAGSGPARSKWSAKDFPSSDMIGVRSTTGICEDEVDPHACAWGWAKEYAVLGHADLAANMCAAVRSTTSRSNFWRHVCFLSAAETHVKHWDRSRYEDSIRLCGASGVFRATCHENLVERLARQAPASDTADDGQWMDHMLRMRTIREAWKDDPMRAELLDRFWAVSMRSSVAQANGLSGDALDHIPSVARPHLHASMAWEAVSRWDGALDLVAIQAEVIDAMSVRLQRANTPVTQWYHDPIVDLWPTDRDGEAHLSAISYVGDSRRTFARDVKTDVALCVLEAAARVVPPASHLLEQARNLPDERIKWTAARLLEQLEVMSPQRPAAY